MHDGKDNICDYNKNICGMQGGVKVSDKLLSEGRRFHFTACVNAFVYAVVTAGENICAKTVGKAFINALVIAVV